MSTPGEPALEQRKVFQPFVDVFNAAIRWHKSHNYDKTAMMDDLDKTCEKALQDLAQNAIDAYLATLPAKQKEAQ